MSRVRALLEVSCTWDTARQGTIGGRQETGNREGPKEWEGVVRSYGLRVSVSRCGHQVFCLERRAYHSGCTAFSMVR